MVTSSERGSGLVRAGGLAAWLLARWRGHEQPRPSLALLERITLAPRQSLALVEAEGRRFLVATSAEGTPAFHALDEPAGTHSGRGLSRRTSVSRTMTLRTMTSRTRISW